MILNSVTVENFRSFYGEQTIEFSTDKKSNTTIIYALNGVGKTNLLNAILWCLHGEFSSGFKNPKDVLNWEAKRRGRKSFHVTLNFEESGVQYMIKRSGGDVENFKVFQILWDGNTVELTSAQSQLINSIIPKDMAGYFISDGEGSDLVVERDGYISVRRSIRDILGFNVAEKTLNDLSTIKNEVRQDLKKFDKDSELSELEDKIQVFDESIVRTRQSLLGDKSILETYEDKLQVVETQLGNSSSIVVDQLISQRSKASVRLRDAESKLVSLESKKIKLIREYSWVAFAHPLTKEALDFIDESELKGKIPAPFNLQLVKDILEKSECICGACIEPGSVAYDKINALIGKAADPELLQRLQRARSSLTEVKTLSSQARQRIEENFKEVRDTQDLIQTLEAELEDVSSKILELDDEKIRELEKERNRLKHKIRETERSVYRLEDRVLDLQKGKKDLEAQAKRIEGLSPRAKTLKAKIDLIEEVVGKISEELEKAEAEVHHVLAEKIDAFLEKYLRQDYRVSITSDLKICLQDRNGRPVPPSGGQAAILSFIYISSLISIARERRDLDSSILTPGAIAPLVFDAPFSKLDPKYAPNVARELPKLVDQLIVLMYQDDGKNVSEILRAEGRLGKEYYFCEEIAGEQNGRDIHALTFNGKSVPVTLYECPIDKVVVKEVLSYE
jgi:DNA sulfur modification protein DndD